MDELIQNLKAGEVDLRLPLALTGLVVVFIGFTCVKKKERNTGDLLNELQQSDKTKARNGEMSVAEAAAVWKLSTDETSRHLKLITNAGGAQRILEDLRQEKYDNTNSAHEALLERLWSALRPNITRTGRISNDWEQIGFQGKDPATDFRGNGLLGLINLVYFAENHTQMAQRIIADAGFTDERAATQKWYMFAVAGINLTTVVSNWLKSGSLDRFFYNTPLTKPSNNVDHLTLPAVMAHCQVYSALFISFHKFWAVKQPGIMEFNMFLNDVVVPANDPLTIQKEA